jgi:hypothetical protein
MMFFPRIIHELFQPRGDGIVNPISAALDAYRRRDFAHHDDAETEFDRESGLPGLFFSSAQGTYI